MDRRHFLRRSALAGGTLLGTAGMSEASSASLLEAGPAPDFHLHYAPHLGMFANHAGSDPVDQIAFMAEQGFTAFEDNGMRGRSKQEQTRIADALREHDMQMGVFVAHSISWQEPALVTGEDEPRRKFLDEIRGSVEVAQRVGATWMTVVPGARDLRLDPGFQRANLIETLREAAAILEPHDLVMVLEPLNNRRDHPNQFLTRTAQAYEICRAVDSPSCKILYDVYHQQITEGNLIPNFDAAREEIAYVQVGDNPGRNEPTTGEINFRNVFAHLYEKGYEGVVGMEHGVSGEGTAGEKAVIEAYRTCDSFET
ncbi:MAG: hydroxypyruvate isomerase family protein [Salinibacter sp.]